MSVPQIVSRDAWLVARTKLPIRDTQQRDALNADSRRPPTEEIEKHFVFENVVEDLRSRGVQLETFDGGHLRARNDERGNT